VEQPLRYLPRLRGRRLLVTVGATVGIPVLLATGLYTAAQHSFWSPRIAAYQVAVTEVHVVNAVGCHTFRPISLRSAADCTWNAGASGKPIYLVGDSNGMQFGEAVIGAGRQLGRPVVAATTTACPFVDAWFADPGDPGGLSAACRTYYDGTYGWLLSQPAGVVVVAMSDDQVLDVHALGTTPGSRITDPAAKLAVYHQALLRTVDGLVHSGKTVLLVPTVPHWVPPYRFSPSECSLPSVLTGGCFPSMPLSFMRQRQGPVAEAVADVARRTGSTLLDLTAVLCRGGTCSVEGDGLVRYQDPTHISVPQSEALVPDFVAAIGRAGG
jgi:hypothetical protein